MKGFCVDLAKQTAEITHYKKYKMLTKKRQKNHTKIKTSHDNNYQKV